MSSELTRLVRDLAEAENRRDKAKVASILVPNFTVITRARGEEQNRNDLLKEVKDPKNSKIHRRVNVLPPLSSGNIGVVRSLVTTTDRANPQASPKRYRNVHVFENQQGVWKCVAWQVTELKQAA